MENNEIMNIEEFEVMDPVIVEDEGNGLGTGLAMLIGAGVACAIGAGVQLAKKGIAAIKAKRALKKPDREILVDESDVVEVASK